MPVIVVKDSDVQLRYLKTWSAFANAVPMDAVDETNNVSGKPGRTESAAWRELADPAPK